MQTSKLHIAELDDVDYFQGRHSWIANISNGIAFPADVYTVSGGGGSVSVTVNATGEPVWRLQTGVVANGHARVVTQPVIGTPANWEGIYRSNRNLEMVTRINISTITPNNSINIGFMYCLDPTYYYSVINYRPGGVWGLANRNATGGSQIDSTFVVTTSLHWIRVKVSTTSSQLFVSTDMRDWKLIAENSTYLPAITTPLCGFYSIVNFVGGANLGLDINRAAFFQDYV